MINKDRAEKIAGDAATCINDVIHSAMAVRGERFAQTVGDIFNLHAMTKGLAFMASLADDTETAEAVAKKMLEIISQISDSLLGTLETDELRAEA